MTTDRETPDPLLTPAEVAVLFRVNPKTVSRWAPAIKDAAARITDLIGGRRA